MLNISFAVGSTNKIKIQAVVNATRLFWPDAQVVGIKTITKTEKQPKTDKETKIGAINRAKKALLNYPKANFGVGLESGIEFRNDGCWTFGWVAIIDGKGKMGLAKTIEFRLPFKLAQLIKKGMEQGEADSVFFKRQDRGTEEGTVGLLTKGKVNRETVFSQAVIFSLIPFLNLEYYEED